MEKNKDISKDKGEERTKTRYVVIREFSGSRKMKDVLEEALEQCILRDFEERRLEKAG